MGTLDFGQVALKWDPKNLEIRTMSVEKTLEPLVLQVTTLVNTKGPSKKKKGKSKRASALVAAVEKATDIFIERGEQIAYENPDITQEMLSAVDEVRKTGSAMSIAAREFSEDPCSSLKRGNMVRAARNLLSAVTRLLILADMVDVHLLLKSLHVVEDDLDKLRNASSQDELMNNMRQFGRNANELIKQAAKRQQELKDPQLRDDLAAARAVLKKHSTMLLTASKVYVRHPELDLAKVNRDHILKQVCEAVNTISDVAQGKATSPQDIYVGAGELAPLWTTLTRASSWTRWRTTRSARDLARGTAGEHHQCGGADGRRGLYAGRAPRADRGRVQCRSAGAAGSTV